MRNYTHVIYIAQQTGVNFDVDFHAQNIGGLMADLARDYGYRKPKNANGSTGRYFFALLKRRRITEDKSNGR